MSPKTADVSIWEDSEEIIWKDSEDSTPSTNELLLVFETTFLPFPMVFSPSL